MINTTRRTGAWVALVLLLTPTVASAQISERMAVCETIHRDTASWRDLATYIDKLAKNGLSAPERAYIEDTIREREGRLVSLGDELVSSEDLEVKALGIPIEDKAARMGKLAGDELVTFVEEGLPSLVQSLDDIATYCGDGDDEEDEDDGEDEPAG